VRAGAGRHVDPLRLAAGLVRFGLAFGGALIRLAVESVGTPDPIHLQPRVLLHAGPAADDREP
jgi:hypothetical protein